MSTFYKLSVKEIRRETPNAVSVVFHIPQELETFYTFIAGQYVNLKLTLDGKEIRRAYSICSAPKSGELRIAIKAIANGTFSKFANEQLQVGHVIEVGTPEGRFTFEPQQDRQKNYMAFVAGSGITPVLSILQNVLQQEPKSSFVLVYGNKTPEDTIFYQQLNQLQSQFLGRLSVHYVFSQKNIEGQLFGRIDKSVVNFVWNKHTGTEFSKYYLCGPEEMITSVNSVLTEKNVAEKDIKFELFSTSASTTSSDAEGSSEHATLTVLVDGEEQTFEMSTKQTILEATLKQGMDAPYSCQGGVCSSCIAKVTNGSATMRKNSILSDKEIASGLVLTCQAVPTSKTLTVDYDDV